MKKLVLSLLLSIVAANSFAMTFQLPENAQYQITHQPNNAPYILAGVIGVGSIFFGTIAAGMYFDYLKSKLPYPHAFAQNNQPNQVNNNNQEAAKFNWAPYAKIAAGLGLTGLTAYLGCKQTPKPQNMVSTITNEPAASSSGGTSLGNTLSPNIMISFASAYTLAPMVPAYFLLKSGYEDLKAERDLACHKEYAKTALGQAPVNAPAPTY